MGERTDQKSPVGRRLQEARKRRGISQKQLGILAGIDQFSASPRINQYERDKHIPDFATAKRLAGTLGVPVSYLYTDDDNLAEVICLYAELTPRKRTKFLRSILESLG